MRLCWKISSQKLWRETSLKNPAVSTEKTFLTFPDIHSSIRRNGLDTVTHTKVFKKFEHWGVSKQIAQFRLYGLTGYWCKEQK